MSRSLPIVERFHSLQGEGAHAGRSAFFIRLASCKVGCAWCDTKTSWSAKSHPIETILTLAKDVVKAQEDGAAFVVLTGGEPLHHNLEPLCDEIKNQTSIPIHLETSGVDELTGSPNWVTLSPKRHAPPRHNLLIACDEIKVVIDSKEDLVFAEEISLEAIAAKKDYQKPLLFLQPSWKNKTGHDLAIEFVKKNSEWRLSLQTHKWLGVL